MAQHSLTNALWRLDRRGCHYLLQHPNLSRVEPQAAALGAPVDHEMPGCYFVHGFPAHGTGQLPLGAFAVLYEFLGTFSICHVLVKLSHIEPEAVAGLAPVNDDPGIPDDIHGELAAGAMARHNMLNGESDIYV